jgi:DNA polymerase-3 subunit chi
LKVDFYYLTRTPVEQTLPLIAEKVVGQGQRLLVVSGDDDQLKRLDTALWTYRADSFLPHGREGDQPILLAETICEEGFQNVSLCDGVWREEALSFDRTFYLFDAETVGNARTAWRSLSALEEAECRYWKQTEEGRWVEGP